jgi:hypothetical protein
MAKYVITWSSKHDSGSRTELSAARAYAWIVKFRNRGPNALTIEVKSDGEDIKEKYLEALAKYETEGMTGRPGRPRRRKPPPIDDRDA